MAVNPGEFFRKSNVQLALESDDLNSFIVLITKRDNAKEISPISTVLAAKPLIYISSVCGLQMFQYAKNRIRRINKFGQIYSLLLMFVIVILAIFNKPVSWIDTRLDLPLNILTQTFGWLHNIEIVSSIWICSFCNSTLNIKMFTILDGLSRHFKMSTNCFRKERWLSIFLVLAAFYELIGTFLLRRFQIRNLPVHLTFFVLSIQGYLIIFLVINMCSMQIKLNTLLQRKVATITCNSEERTSKISSSMMKKIKKKFMHYIFKTKNVEEDTTHYCWLELMQIYDKISDCYFLFNKMYGVQILFMFLTWLMCTLLLICRSLSPSLNFAELFLSDLFIYTCINIRPFILAIMCEVIVKERSKTLNTLLQYLLRGNLDKAYHNQVQTMVDLVKTRRLEISANLFLVNIPTVAHFAGRAISYVVLMIQYFYNHVLGS